MPTFKKLDRAAIAADEPLDGFVTKTVGDDLGAVNEQRLLKYHMMWDVTSQPIWGSVTERWTPMYWPISPEAGSLRFRLRYTGLYATVKIRASLILGPHQHTDPGDWVSLATTAGARATSDWITVDLTEAHRRGLSTARVAIHVLSEASGTTYNFTAAGTNNRYQYFAVTDNPIAGAGFNAEDCLGIQLRDGSGVDQDYLLGDVAQVIRMESVGRLYMWPPPPRDDETLNEVTTIRCTRFGQITVSCITVEEIHGGPYISSRQTFPWQDEDEQYLQTMVGRGGSGSRLGNFYHAQETLLTQRTPVYAVFPPPLGGDRPASWGAFDNHFLQYCYNHIRTGGGTYEVLCEVPIGEDVTLTGAAPISKRRALDISLFVLPCADPAPDHRFTFQALRMDESDATTASGDEITEVIQPIVPYNMANYIHRFRAVTTATASRNNHARNNLHGFFDLDYLGATGMVEIKLSVNDTSATPGRYLRIHHKSAQNVLNKNWTFVVFGCIVRPPVGEKGRAWSDIGKV